MTGRILSILGLAVLFFGVAAIPAAAQRAKPTKTAVKKTAPDQQAVLLYRKRASASKALQTLQRDHRQTADQAVRVLKKAGYTASDVAPALIKDARLSPSKAAALLKASGYSAIDIVNGLQKTETYTAGQMVRVLQEARFPVIEVGPALAIGIRASAAETAETMKEAGYSAEEVARVLKDDYDLSVYETAQTLEDAGFYRYDITRALPAVGYAVERPGLTRYSIVEYRPGKSGRLYDDGILDTERTPQDDNPADVRIEGQGLDDPWLRVSMGSRGTSFEAEILEQSSTQVRARFSEFYGGTLTVHGTGGRAQMSAKALAYYWVEPDVLPSFLEGLDVAVGDPVGEGRVSLMGQSQVFSIEPFEQAGLSLNVVNLNSQGSSVTVLPGTEEGRVRLVVTIDFEEGGRELQGTFAETIPMWTCGTFEVPRSACDPLTLMCLANQLGAAFQSALTCGNLNNWREEQQPGPAISVEGDLLNPKVHVEIDLDGRNDIEAVQTTISFSGTVSIAGPTGDIPLTLIQGWIEEQVDHQLREALRDVDLGADVAAALEGIRTTIGPGMPSRALYPHQGGIFIDMAERF